MFEQSIKLRETWRMVAAVPSPSPSPCLRFLVVLSIGCLIPQKWAALRHKVQATVLHFVYILFLTWLCQAI